MELECTRHAMCGVVCADTVPIMTQSPYDLEQIMAILVVIFGAMNLTLSEKKIETVGLPISTCCADDAKCIQRIAAKYRETISSVYLEITRNYTQRLTARFVRWVSFIRYR